MKKTFRRIFCAVVAISVLISSMTILINAYGADPLVDGPKIALQNTHGTIEVGQHKTRNVVQSFIYNEDSLARLDFMARKDALLVAVDKYMKCSVYKADVDNTVSDALRNSPIGTALASATYKIDNIPVGTATTMAWITFDIPDIITVPGTKYVAIIEFVDKTIAGSCTIGTFNTAPLYADGGAYYYDPRNVISGTNYTTLANTDCRMKLYKNAKDEVALDRSYTENQYEVGIAAGKAIGQSFIYNENILSRMDFKARKDANVAAGQLIKLSIFNADTANEDETLRDFPTGTALSTTTYNSDNIPLGTGAADCEWFTFDLPDIATIPGNKYVAVIEFNTTPPAGAIGFGYNCLEPFYTDGYQIQCDPRFTPRVWSIPTHATLQPENFDLMFKAYKAVFNPINFGTYKESEAKITNIALNTTVENFLTAGSASLITSVLTESQTSLSYDTKGNGEVVGTGTTITASYNGAPKRTYTALIYGDVSGDGDIDVDDLVSIRDTLLESDELEGVYQLAGDLYDENGITLNSLVGLMAYISESGTINQNK